MWEYSSLNDPPQLAQAVLSVQAPTLEGARSRRTWSSTRLSAVGTWTISGSRFVLGLFFMLTHQATQELAFGSGPQQRCPIPNY